jgi:hypothetical protein
MREGEGGVEEWKSERVGEYGSEAVEERKKERVAGGTSGR